MNCDRVRAAAFQQSEEKHNAQRYCRQTIANNEAHLPYVAGTLNGLGDLHITQRMKEAEAAYGEALSICLLAARCRKPAPRPTCPTCR